MGTRTKAEDTIYREQNRPRIRMGLQSWRKRNPEKQAIIVRRQIERRKTDPEVKRKLNEWRRNDARKRKLKLIAAYGGKCACCGEKEMEFLTIDHIDGRGVHFRTNRDYESKLSEETRKTRKVVIGDQIAFFKFLEKNGFPKDDYRLLCMNCNWATGKWGYCPHQRNEVAR
jgi:hypothetical protein